MKTIILDKNTLSLISSGDKTLEIIPCQTTTDSGLWGKEYDKLYLSDGENKIVVTITQIKQDNLSQIDVEELACYGIKPVWEEWTPVRADGDGFPIKSLYEFMSYRKPFIEYWDKTHEKPYDWHSDPLVWFIYFKKTGGISTL